MVGDPVDLNVLDPNTGTCKWNSQVNPLQYSQANCAAVDADR
jgi:hypothetical protein